MNPAVEVEASHQGPSRGSTLIACNGSLICCTKPGLIGPMARAVLADHLRKAAS